MDTQDKNTTTLPADQPSGQSVVSDTAALEATLSGLWREVLGVATVERESDFFALGGHSLSAVRLLSRVRQQWQLDLPMRALFEASTLKAFAKRPEWSGLGEFRLRESQQGPDLRVPRDAPLPTSYSQRRMWLVQQLNPQTTAYNMPFTVRLRGPLDADRLAQALDQVARRHEAFRTRFVSVDGEPAQVIDAHAPVPLTRVDLRHVPNSQREVEARRVLRNAATHRFDLSVAALHTTTLIELADDDHVLMWLMHHAIGDQWAAGIVMGELQQAYSALVEGRELRWPGRGVEFADYANWQRGAVHTTDLESQLAYWRDQLRDVPPLALPTDKPRRGPISGAGGTVHLDLGAERLNAVRRFSVQQGVTPFMTLLACFNVMLARYSGLSDIAVGVPVANRHLMAAESVVGTLVNTVVMRNTVPGEMVFTELLARVKDTALAAYAHQDLPFNVLVQELATRRDRNFSPLVQVMFNVLNAPYRLDAFAGLEAEAFAFDQGASQFDLSLTVDTETFGQIQLEYASDLFEEATAQRMLEGYVAVLDRLLAAPQSTVQSVELMGSSERAELQRWNATVVDFEPGLRLGDLIRRRALASSNATAIEFEGRSVSYGELDASARALALRLRATGAGPGSLVGVCLERSIELVTALVGVVYSGAAYVPLDPSYPPDRLARMCEDARMSMVVSRAEELRQVGRAFAGDTPIVRIDMPAAEQPRGHAAALADFALVGAADDPAYVIFTSGSTGRPKGAMNAHKGVVNWLQWMQAEYGLTPRDRVLLKTPYSFDVSLREFFWPLMTGATIVVARPEGHRDSAYLVELIRSERITLLHFVPSMLHIFLDEHGVEECRSVQRVVCSGEALPADVVEMFFRRMPHARLCNLYGPTEAAVEVTYWECQAGDASGIVPIGRPVANTQMHVLDSQMRPQPVGVPGELYIGGVQVGMGYAGRPELTAERFLPDPFNPGGTLYKTGDVARWLGSGVIDYLGRADDQVKIRGHRIELGEIETQLGTHPDVARCVVVVREDSPGDKRLVAYVVARGDTPSVTDLRDHLRQHLPDTMVPRHYVGLQSIPLLTNGKINRAALPMPNDTAVVRDTAYWVPRTDAEVALAQVWEELLGVDQVSATDNFFDLGGHSLLAMRAVSEIHKALGVRIGVRRLVFETLGQLAASLDADPARHAPPAPVKASTMKYVMNGLQRMLLSRGVSKAG